MEVIKTGIDGLLLIKPKIFNDDRGYFYESYQEKSYKEAGVHSDFVQDNQSLSQKGVLRGLHFQKPPFAQAKLVRVLQGAVLDVAVDLRKDSPSYGKHYAVVLSAENHLQFFIAEGFAHGFLTLEDQTIFTYKCSQYYNKESEGSIIYNDPILNIEWGVGNPILSEKDLHGVLFNDFVTPF